MNAIKQVTFALPVNIVNQREYRMRYKIELENYLKANIYGTYYSFN